MLNFIVKRTPQGQQLILAVEESPAGLLFDGTTIELNTPYGLLEADKYDAISGELEELIAAISVAVDARLANQRLEVLSELSD